MNNNSDTISVIDIPKRQVAGTLSPGYDVNQIVMNKNGTLLAVLSDLENKVTFFDTATLEKTLHTIHLTDGGAYIRKITLTPDGQALLVTTPVDGDKVSIYPTAYPQYFRDIKVGLYPDAVTVLNNGTHALVANCDDPSLMIL